MIHTNVVGVLPAESHLQIMTIMDKVQKPLSQSVALIFGYSVNVLDMAANGEDALPSGDGVGSHNGVDSLEFRANVLGGTTRLGVQLKATTCSDFVK